MSNPRMEQLKHSALLNKLGTLAMAILLGVLARLIYDFSDSVWVVLFAFLIFLPLGGVWGGLAAAWSIRRELKALELVERHNVHGPGSTFVEEPPTINVVKPDFWRH